jgi:hypothetical protein
VTQQGLESAQRVCGCVQARCAQAFCSAGGVEACSRRQGVWGQQRPEEGGGLRVESTR